jgi:hypothetical protein
LDLIPEIPAADYLPGLDGIVEAPVPIEMTLEELEAAAASRQSEDDHFRSVAFCVATGEGGYQLHRRHRCRGTHPVARGRFFASTVPRRHAHEPKLKLAVRAEPGRA